ncbi:MAG: BREX-1 system adenine-specific DNA-methyltransferase PglX [Faecalibacterium prausnitzii]
MQLDGLLDILTDAKEYGSILNVPEYNWALLRRFVGGIDDEVQISLESAGVEQTAEELQKLIDLGETMARKYWVTCTNPPYAGTSNLSANVNNFVKKYYPDSKADLFAVFIERCRAMTADNGYQAMITQHSWMFLSSFEKLREKMMLTETVNMAHLGARAFEEIGGEVVQTTAFVRCANHVEGYKGTYCRLIEPTSQQGKEEMFLAGQNRYTANQDDFAKIPGMPVAYWVSEKVRDAFANNPMIDDVLETRNGMSTTNNNLFLRCWFEISLLKCGLGDFTRQSAKQSKRKWFRYNKGGEFRRWFGNNDYVVNWENDGEYLKSYVAERYGSYSKEIRSEDRYFDESITWSGVTSSQTGFRYSPQGAIFDSGANGLFAQKAEIVKYTLGFLNTKLVVDFVKCVNPTINTGSGTIGKLPLCIKDSEIEKVNLIVEECIENSRSDWDSFETSWDFTTHPLVNMSKSLWDATSTAAAMDYFYGYLPEASCPLEICYLLWQGQCKERFEKLKANEEELNRIFIDIYGLQDELTPEVEEKDVTVRKADLQRDIKSLLSYAVGCMFGRYSLDVPGLVLAGQPFEEKFVHASNAVTGTGVLGAPGLLRAPGALYLRTEDGVKQCTFAPDVDNVIPITDEEYLEDDIIARLCDWLKVVYGADTLEANLDYIAKALGNKGTTSREVIRNYFVNDFFKDHCQTYSVTGSGKRLIYWLFDSGKQNGFKALVYLHRYTPDTIGTLRVDYLHKMQRVYESEINRMQDMMEYTTNAREAAAASKRKDKLTKQLKECRDYDEKISHLALSRIALDLDDGVKVNYRKLQTAADGKFYEVLADSKNIMVKEKK